MSIIGKEQSSLQSETLTAHHDRHSSPRSVRFVRALGLISLFAFVLGTSLYTQSHTLSVTTAANRAIQCSTKNLRTDLSFLSSASPITKAEFIARQDRLAEALQTSRLDAFLFEPGYTFQYYGNVSQRDWEPWEPEERPFLMIISPYFNWKTRRLQAKTTFLAPKFEEERVRMLEVPATGDLEIITYEEHWDPYETLHSHLVVMLSELRMETVGPLNVVVDDEMREFVARGLRETDGINLHAPSEEIEALRKVKDPAEINILRAVNTGTVEAIRAMRPCLSVGMTENQVKNVLDQTLLSAGFESFFNLVLFDEDAASPHRASGHKRLQKDTLILIDVGAHYLGYSSDITRTFFLPGKKSSNWSLRKWVSMTFLGFFRQCAFQATTTDVSSSSTERLVVWNIVSAAQEASMKTLRSGATVANIDITARDFIRAAGYGDMAHRVGHGIGIKAHEPPYLHKGNNETLRPGTVVTLEPGIYLQGKFGVRIEDAFLVTEHGEPEVLSGRRGTSPWDP